MTFKVGDKVRIVAKNCGHGFKIGQVVTLEEKTGETEWFAGEYYMQEKEFEPIGKTLTELDVKPGDVVRLVKDGDDGWLHPDVGNEEQIASDGSWFCIPPDLFHELDCFFEIVSRAPQPQPSAEPEKPKRMHPDDVADAITEYLADCGYVLDNISFYGESGTHTYRP